MVGRQHGRVKPTGSADIWPTTNAVNRNFRLGDQELTAAPRGAFTSDKDLPTVQTQGHTLRLFPHLTGAKPEQQGAEAERVSLKTLSQGVLR